jgi:hypothetical protein
MHMTDPVTFRDGFRMDWRNGDVSDPATGLKCTQLKGASELSPHECHTVQGFCRGSGSAKGPPGRTVAGDGSMHPPSSSAWLTRPAAFARPRSVAAAGNTVGNPGPATVLAYAWFYTWN